MLKMRERPYREASDCLQQRRALAKSDTWPIAFVASEQFCLPTAMEMASLWQSIIVRYCILERESNATFKETVAEAASGIGLPSCPELRIPSTDALGEL